MSVGIKGQDVVTGSFDSVLITQQGLHVNTYIWDTNTLQWIKNTGSAGGGGGNVTVLNWPSVYPINDNGGSITIDGTIGVNNFPATQVVSWSGQSVGISGTVPITDNGGSITVDGSLTITPDTYSAKAGTAFSSGDTTIHTPAAGKAIRLHYISINADGANSTDCTTILKFAAGGSSIYKLCLKAGAMWARNIGAGRRYIQGGINEALIINLSAAQNIHYSIEYEEI